MSEIGKQRLAKLREEYRIRRHQIWDEYVAGTPVKVLAAKYKVTTGQISNVLSIVENENLHNKSTS